MTTMKALLAASVRTARIVCAGAMAMSIPALAQTYPNKPIRMVIPYPQGGRTGSRRGGWFWGGDGARPPGLMDGLAATLAKIVCAGAMAMSIPALAQIYPNKPIRMVIPYPPGGGTDTLARPLAQRLTDALRQQVIIDNRGGANGNIGMEIVAKSPPDGYTLVLALTAQLAVNPSLYRRLPYDPVRDFQPITLLGTGPYTLLVHPSLPAKNVKELIALARSKPGELAYGSAGNGSGAHLASELLGSMAGVKMVHVPYKGAGPALVDLIAGNLQVLFATYLSCRQHIEAGRVRALAVTTSKRLSGVDIPTIAEAALPGYDAGVWYAVLAPAGTPRDIVTRLHGEIVRAGTHPEMKKLFSNAGIEPINSSPEELAAYIKSELAKWARVAREAKVEVD